MLNLLWKQVKLDIVVSRVYFMEPLFYTAAIYVSGLVTTMMFYIVLIFLLLILMISNKNLGREGLQ